MSSGYDIVERTSKDLSERRKALAEKIVMGAAKDYADYKLMVGEVKGLDEAIVRIDELTMLSEDD